MYGCAGLRSYDQGFPQFVGPFLVGGARINMIPFDRYTSNLSISKHRTAKMCPSTVSNAAEVCNFQGTRFYGFRDVWGYIRFRKGESRGYENGS